MTKATFFTRCAEHDWNYMYADDSWVYHNGQEERQALERLCRKQPELEAIFLAWFAHKCKRTPRPVFDTFDDSKEVVNVVDNSNV